MSRYAKRSATSGAITLNSARKGGNTLGYWYFIQIGKRWIEFDVRDLAKKAGLPIPALCGEADFAAIRAGHVEYEQVLQRDLQRVADFCAHVDAVRLLTTPAKQGAPS